jgi:hypothetical protein
MKESGSIVLKAASTFNCETLACQPHANDILEMDAQLSRIIEDTSTTYRRDFG